MRQGNFIEKTIEKEVIYTPNEKFCEILGKYVYEVDDNIRYCGVLSNTLAKGKELRNRVIILLSIVSTKFLKKGDEFYYLLVKDIPIQKCIVCGIVVDVVSKPTAAGEYKSVFTIFDGYAFRRVSGYKIKLSEDECKIYKGMFVRCFCNISKFEYNDKEVVRLAIDRKPKLVQPIEYILHKRFIEEKWSPILEDVLEESEENEESVAVVEESEGVELSNEVIEKLAQNLVNLLEYDNTVYIGDIVEDYDVLDDECIEKVIKLAEELWNSKYPQNKITLTYNSELGVFEGYYINE